MNGWDQLDRLLTTDPRDSGCGHAMELLDAYADLLDAGHDPAQRYPEISAHLGQCGPCSQDLAGLLDAIGHKPGLSNTPPASFVS